MSRKIKGPFKIVGVTENKMPVVGGLFDMYQTHGFPLDILVDYFEAKGWTVSTLDMAAEMYVAGVKPSTIPDKVACLFESHSPEWRNEVITRLKRIISETEAQYLDIIRREDEQERSLANRPQEALEGGTLGTPDATP
jgi:alanyl-tRNA synthetase